MDSKTTIRCVRRPDHILSYFRQEFIPLALVTVSGLVYNIGLAAGPYFEGQLVQRLADIIGGNKTMADMAVLAAVYLMTILLIQGMRCVKRFYVRRFANDTARNMRRVLYRSLLHQSKAELDAESVGAMMTKAVTDVDACVEGMRKFTTEIFDTGIVLISYLTMLFWYDWRLTLISCSFTAVAYVIADRLKGTVTKYSAAYRAAEGQLNDATLDRIGGAVTYRIHGQEANRNAAYEEQLADYEKRAVLANIWETTMQPVYHVISMCGVVFILYFGAKNVAGTGWAAWDLAAFTTFLSCFTKMALKSSKAAKLFNAVQKAQVSWKRVKPLLREVEELAEETEKKFDREMELEVSHLSFAYPGEKNVKMVSEGTKEQKDPQNTSDGAADPESQRETTDSADSQKDQKKRSGRAETQKKLQDESCGEMADGRILKNISFHAREGEIIGITGPVAGGKSTFGRAFLCEYPYEGSIRIGSYELSELTEYERSRLISYLGHQPELMSDTLENNIRYGKEAAVAPYLEMTSLTQEVSEMRDGILTYVGSGGMQLSGGQQDRAALARTLYHGRKILILDDPFSAVDKKTEREIMEKLRPVLKSRIVFLISHRLTMFPEFDRVLWIEEGSCQAGTHESLMRENESYRELYLAQSGGGDLDEA